MYILDTHTGLVVSYTMTPYLLWLEEQLNS